MVEHLYKASQAGVKIRLIVQAFVLSERGFGVGENIDISIIDKFLEHSRIFIFCNGGKEKYYIGSADWMTRNLDNRVEVACPIFDQDVQRMRAYFELQWQDGESRCRRSP